ncbi:MAG: glutathione S-transferase family protein [Rhodospirillaceae bacterium]|nr:glutathione S-transferase family protein [Rhodospirillaceae bacterium]
MKLLLRGPSPFGRKGTFAIAHLGLSDRVDVGVPDDEESLRKLNPLAKVPALIIEDGTALFDSRVILEYLDMLAGGDKIIPVETGARFGALREAALADGILEGALLVTYEGRYRPDQTPYEPWLDFQRGKVGRGLAAMADAPPAITPLTVGGIGLACALEYIDFREQYDWRPEFPALVAWLDDFNAAHPVFADSKPSD